MRPPIAISLLVLLPLSSAPFAAAEMGAVDLLAAAIAHHDPEGRWAESAYRLTVRESRPDGTHRETQLLIDNRAGRFEISTQREGAQIDGELGPGECTLRLDGSAEISDEDRTKHRLTCDRLELMRNYYTYLWGLPMKLRDPGARLAPEVRQTEFLGRPALGLRVTYEEEVGSDIWYFYFDPEGKALIGYRFYHDEAANDGEYITLEGETEAGGLRLPATRDWYTHQEDKHLGTDTLTGIERLGGGAGGGR